MDVQFSAARALVRAASAARFRLDVENSFLASRRLALTFACGAVPAELVMQLLYCWRSIVVGGR